jgi:hypothetical protein
VTRHYVAIGGDIFHASGRMIDFADAETFARDWARSAKTCDAIGLRYLAEVYASTALSIGEAWIEARNWRKAAGRVAA